MGRFGIVALALSMLGSTPEWLRAQDGWQATLIVDPLPSPYLSDWEVDVTIGELIVTNTTNSTTDITIYYTLSRNGQVSLNGVTDPQTVLANESVVFNADSDVGGEVDWDAAFEDLLVRTGRLPEGEYEGCVTIVDPNGLVLVDRECVRFSTLYPDPPFLVFPFDRDTITTQDPIFEWLPVQVPTLEEFRVGYVLVIAEVNTEAGQLPEVALESNILHYIEPDLLETSHQYPVGALPFEPGRTYAWRVQALDGQGAPISANSGRSEVWTFVYREAGAEAEQVVASVDVTPGADTLRFVGDTLRFGATAYDEDNVEVFDREFEWRSSDTTIAKVDSTGVVTAVGVGEARIVAMVDGVADTALSVTAVSGGMVARIAFQDPETPSASDLIETLSSATFEEAVAQIRHLLESGQFVLVLPGFGMGGPEGQDRDPDDLGLQPSDIDVFAESRGPMPDEWRSAAGVAGAPASCSEREAPAYLHVDAEKRSFVVGLRAPALAIASFFTCLGAGDWAPPSPTQPLELMFSGIWEEDERRLFLGIKPPRFEVLDRLDGWVWDYAVLVLNFRSSQPKFQLDGSKLPEQVADFYPHKFELKGRSSKEELGDSGLTRTQTDVPLQFYGRLGLVDSPLAGLAQAMGFTDHYLEVQGYPSLTREVREAPADSSSKLGFVLTGTLPKRVPQIPFVADLVDSTQLALELTIGRDKITPKLEHTIELLGVGPGIKLTGSLSTDFEMTKADSASSQTNADTANASTPASLTPDSLAQSAPKDSTGNRTSSSRQWEIEYKVERVGEREVPGEDASVGDWIRFWMVYVKDATVKITYTPCKSDCKANWEIEGSGTWGRGPMQEIGTVTVKYEKKQAKSGSETQQGTSEGPSAARTLADAEAAAKAAREDRDRKFEAWRQAGIERDAAADSLARWERTERELKAEAEKDPAKEGEWRDASGRVTEWRETVQRMDVEVEEKFKAQRAAHEEWARKDSELQEKRRELGAGGQAAVPQQTDNPAQPKPAATPQEPEVLVREGQQTHVRVAEGGWSVTLKFNTEASLGDLFQFVRQLIPSPR